MCRMASLLGLLLLLPPVATSFQHSSLTLPVKRHIDKRRQSGFDFVRVRPRSTSGDHWSLRSNPSDEFETNELPTATNNAMNLYASTRNISFVNRTVSDWPGTRILPAEYPHELFVIEYTSPADGSVTLYPIFEIEGNSSHVSTIPSKVLPASCYNCLGVTLHSSNQRDINEYAENLIALDNCDNKETFDEPPRNTAQALEDATKRVTRLVRRPGEALITNRNDTSFDYPAFVREAAIAQYVTNSTNILERMDVPNDVSIHIRANSSDDSPGNWSIFVQEDDDGRIIEYYLKPAKMQSTDRSLIHISQVKRTFVPIQWKRMLSANFRSSLTLLLGMICSHFYDIPNCGFGKVADFGFEKLADYRFKLFLKVFLASEAIEAIFNWIAVAKNMDPVSSRKKYLDWLEKMPRSFLSSLRSKIVSFGNESPGPLKFGFALLLKFAIPAATEELIFRGFLQTLLSRYIGIGRAIMIQALLFGLAHYGYKSKEYMADCAAQGLWWGYLFAETGFLPLVVFLHLANNLLAGFLGAKRASSLLQYELSNLFANTNGEQEDTTCN